MLNHCVMQSWQIFNLTGAILWLDSQSTIIMQRSRLNSLKSK